MAVDDVYDATNWVINHARETGIDTSKIFLSGSSSGAITVLTAELKEKINIPHRINCLPVFNTQLSFLFQARS